jgi:hypothetical protein
LVSISKTVSSGRRSTLLNGTFIPWLISVSIIYNAILSLTLWDINLIFDLVGMISAVLTLHLLSTIQPDNLGWLSWQNYYWFWLREYLVLVWGMVWWVQWLVDRFSRGRQYIPLHLLRIWIIIIIGNRIIWSLIKWLMGDLLFISLRSWKSLHQKRFYTICFRGHHIQISGEIGLFLDLLELIIKRALA